MSRISGIGLLRGEKSEPVKRKMSEEGPVLSFPVLLPETPLVKESTFIILTGLYISFLKMGGGRIAWLMKKTRKKTNSEIKNNKFSLLSGET